MTRDERDSTEAPAEEESATSVGDGGIQAAALAEKSTANEYSKTNPVGRAFLILRLAGAASIACVVIVLVSLDVLRNGWAAWTVMGLFLTYLALTGEVILRITQRLVQKERNRTKGIFLDREAELQDIASRDDLTQLQNRRFFYERLQEELQRAERSRKQLSIIMIDVDELKLINDEFGHQVGDVILRQFGRTLNRTAAADHVTARLGGDEFAVIMPNADRREAEKLAWRIWDQLGEAPLWENGHASIYLGVSSRYRWLPVGRNGSGGDHPLGGRQAVRQQAGAQRVQPRKDGQRRQPAVLGGRRSAEHSPGHPR